MEDDRTPLDKAQVVARLSAMGAGEWQLVNGALFKRIEFSDFRRAWAFVSIVALIAERLDHHPHLTQCYNWLELRVSTHDPQGISALDIAFVEQVENALHGHAPLR